jgi:hypothetical protein
MSDLEDEHGKHAMGGKQMKKRGGRLLGMALGLAFVAVFLAGCGSSGESDADRAARLSKESPQMKQMRKEKQND